MSARGIDASLLVRIRQVAVGPRVLIAAFVGLALSCSGSPDVARPDDVGEPPVGGLGAEAPRYIITIASNHYDFEGFTPLTRAEQDADAIELAFRRRLGFKVRHTRDGDLRLRGDAATTDGILHLIGDEGSLKGLPREAVAVVYIALHGRTRDCATATTDGDMPMPRRCGQLVTRDARRGSQTIEFTALLDLINRHGPHHTIVLIDTCYGGLALGAPIKELDYATVLRTVPGGTATTARGPAERRSRKVLTSAGPSQAADDGGAGRPGVFAEALLQGLDGEADLYADGWLLFPELAIWLHAEVHRRSGGAQEPEYDGFHEDGRGAPVLGALRLAGGDGMADPDTLVGEAQARVERGEIHGAIWSLRKAVAARAGRALAERRTMREAEALAAAGKGTEAIAVVERIPRSTRGGADPALAVRRQVQARIARQTRQPATEVARLEARAIEAGLDVARHTATVAGWGRVTIGLGGLAAIGGTPQVAGEFAAEVRTATEATAAPGLVAALARNEAVAFAAAGDTARAAAAREVEQAAAAAARAAGASRPAMGEPATSAPSESADVWRAEPSEPATPATPAGAAGTDALTPQSTEETRKQWPGRDKPFIEDEDGIDPLERLGLVRDWIGRMTDGDSPRMEQVERFGRLLAAVERARREGATGAQVAEARVVVIEVMRAMFPLPVDTNVMLTGKWVELPGGDFEMGSPPSEAGRSSDELLHRVRLSPFWLGETEVTVGQLRKLVPDHQLMDGEAMPARGVSWYAAVAYAAWVGARLPTEAEWEYAARWRGTRAQLATTRYCSGDTDADLTQVGWYGANSGGIPHPVKRKASCAGLYDLHGNVYEWVVDWYGRYEMPADDMPLDDEGGPPTGVVRVVRGGSFHSVAALARSAERVRWWPGSRHDWVGFRLARAAPSPGLNP